VVPRIVAIVAILAVVALYLRYTAQRLHALHVRVDAAGAAFDAQLQRRSLVAAAFATAVPLPPQLAVELAAAAADAAAVAGLHHDREVVENTLSRALTRAAAASPTLFATGVPAAVELHDEATRAIFARRFYNDRVRDALTVRDRRTVRWLRLAGSAPHPAYFEMDEEELPTPAVAGASGRRIDV